jgi:predicted translin family RNA/ssDNA-binding protein
MQPNLSLSSLNLSELSILYVLIAIVILLALLAAIGAWARGGGIRREDAESLFSESQERHREEIARLEALLQETRKANEEAHRLALEAQAEAQRATRDAQDRSQETLAAHLQEVDQQVRSTRTSLEAAVSQASAEYSEALSDELEMVARKLAETDRRLSTGLGQMNESLGMVQHQVKKAGDELRNALIEITKQQQDQKAQSTIQMCEALISSLGTLKSTIASQLEHDAVRTLDAEPVEQSYTGIEQTAIGDVRFASDENITPGSSRVADGEDAQFSGNDAAPADAAPAGDEITVTYDTASGKEHVHASADAAPEQGVDTAAESSATDAHCTSEAADLNVEGQGQENTENRWTS